jgi:hypothetical protein
MTCCRETAKMCGPARHRQPTRSGEAGGPPGNHGVRRDYSSEKRAAILAVAVKPGREFIKYPG